MALSVINLSGKIALITGASSGIGADTAIYFAKLGAKLAITGRNAENLKKTSDECLKQPNASQPLMIVADLTKEEDVKRIVNSTIEKFGKLDILVNNAGVAVFGGIEATSLEQFDQVMSVNVRSVYHLTMLAVPHLIKTKGSIVNVSSVCGTKPYSGVVAYCMSKSALDQFTSCIALELAPKGVRVNSVNPGIVVTELQKRAGLTDEAYPKFMEMAKSNNPFGRAAEGEEVAKAIAFLASDAASFTTGDHLHIDGASHCK